MQKIRTEQRSASSLTFSAHKAVLGVIALLATACFMAGETARSGNSAAPANSAQSQIQSQIQSETGAIFSDSMISAITANHATHSQSSADKNYELYFHGVQALHRGHAEQAERDAEQAIAADSKFSDAYALAATAQLSQRKFDQAQSSAQAALDADPSNEKAYVILATADNYLGQYEEAIEALDHVQTDSTTWWQISYQRGRAEAGLGNLQATLDASNRAALQAPEDFAPLHLLHASALVAIAQYQRAADELETYLKLEGKQAPQRDELRRELQRLRQLAHQPIANSYSHRRARRLPIDIIYPGVPHSSQFCQGWGTQARPLKPLCHTRIGPGYSSSIRYGPYRTAQTAAIQRLGVSITKMIFPSTLK